MVRKQMKFGIAADGKKVTITSGDTKIVLTEESVDLVSVGRNRCVKLFGDEIFSSQNTEKTATDQNKENFLSRLPLPSRVKKVLF